MIIGIGTDIVDMRRIARVFGDDVKKAARILTPLEVANLPAKAERRTAYIAKRFAAKEAYAKALGTGFGAHLSFHDVEVSNDSAGKPLLSLSEKATKTLQATCPNGTTPAIHLSLSDEPPYAVAYVVVDCS